MNIENPGMSKEAKAILTSRPWRGNVRELANTIQKALIFSRGGPITLDDISQAIGRERISAERDDTVDEAIRQWVRNTLTSGNVKDMFNALTDRFARVVITEALSITGGNQTRAAELLGISRPTLLSRIEKYRLKIEISIKG